MEWEATGKEFHWETYWETEIVEVPGSSEQDLGGGLGDNLGRPAKMKRGHNEVETPFKFGESSIGGSSGGIKRTPRRMKRETSSISKQRSKKKE